MTEPCPICEGTGVDLSTFVPATHLSPSEAEPCPNGCPFVTPEGR